MNINLYLILELLDNTITFRNLVLLTFNEQFDLLFNSYMFSILIFKFL